MRLVKLFNIDFVYGPRCGDAGEQRVFLLLLFFVLSRARDDGTTDDRTRRRDRTKITERRPRASTGRAREETGLNWASLIIK